MRKRRGREEEEMINFEFSLSLSLCLDVHAVKQLEFLFQYSPLLSALLAAPLLKKVVVKCILHDIHLTVTCSLG